MLDWGFLLHSLAVYTIVGSGLAFGLFLVVCRIFRLDAPRLRVSLLLLVLATPLLATLFNYFLWPVLTKEPGPQCVSGFFAGLCPLGKLGSDYYVPIILLIVLGCYRGLMYYVYQYRICQWTITPKDPCYRRPLGYLSSLATKADLVMPKIRIINQQNYSCFTYGLLHPTIVISQALLLRLDDEELEAVLAHELGHIRYRDQLWKKMGLILRDLGFFLPFAHWSWRLLQDEQELAADDFAIKLTEKPLIYGATLIKAWRDQQGAGKQFFSASAFAGGARTTARVLRVLHQEYQEFATLPFLVPVLGIMMVVLLSFVC